jgi:hypothetical protein
MNFPSGTAIGGGFLSGGFLKFFGDGIDDSRGAGLPEAARGRRNRDRERLFVA